MQKATIILMDEVDLSEIIRRVGFIGFNPPYLSLVKGLSGVGYVRVK